MAEVGVEVGVLGSVTCSDGAHDIPLGGVKPRAVLAYLALHARRVVSVSDLIDAVWGDAPPDTATNTVQVHISALRRVLGPCGVGVEREGAGYRLDVAPTAVDLHRFEAIAAQGRAELRGGHPERAHDLLTQALGLWRGRPFDGIDGIAFVEAARPAIENVRASAAVELVECLTELGRHDEATVAAEQLVAQSPYDERAWAAAMVGYYWAGRPTDALRAFQRARAVLADDLGLEPGPQLVALELAVLNHSLPPPARARATPAAEGPTVVLPADIALVGREEVVERVVRRLESGQRLMSLVGLGGIGKTSLATRVGHRIAESGNSVWFVDLSSVTDAASASDEVAAALGDGLDATSRHPADADADATWSLVILDNVEQIVDAGQLVVTLLDARPSARFLVTSRRPVRVKGEQVEAITALPIRESDGELGAAVGLFLERAELVYPDLDGVEPDVIGEICELVAGIPLGIELAALQLRALTPAGLLDRLRTYQFAALDATGTDDYPDRHHSLRAVVESTVALLSDAARCALDTLAVVEGAMTVDLVERTATQRSQALDAIADLIESGLVVRGRGDDRVHAPVPVRQHVASAMTDTGRAATEQRLADAVGDLIESADGHWFGPEADVHRARLSTDAAAVDAVVAMLRRRGRWAALAAMALALAPFWLQRSRLVDALATLDAIRDSELTPDLAARVRTLRGTFASYLNRDDTAELLEDSLATAAVEGVAPDRVIVNGWCCLGAFHANFHRDDDVRRCVDRATEAASISGDPTLIALARDFAGYAAGYLGDVDTAIRLTLDAIGDARQQGDRYALVLLLATATDSLLRAGRIDEADIFITEAFDLARTVDLGPALIWVLLMVGATQLELDRPSAAWGSLTGQLRSMVERYPDPVLEADSLSLIAAVHAVNGDDVAAARTWGASIAIHGDQGVDSSRRRLPGPQRWWNTVTERLGEARFEALLTAGSADPQRVIDELLAAEPATFVSTS